MNENQGYSPRNKTDRRAQDDPPSSESFHSQPSVGKEGDDPSASDSTSTPAPKYSPRPQKAA